MSKMGAGKRRALARLTGPVLYCPDCAKTTGTYQPPEGKIGIPKPAARICPACVKQHEAQADPKPKAAKKKRRIPSNPALPEKSSKFDSSSVRTVSGGLPTLGRRHKLSGHQAGFPLAREAYLFRLCSGKRRAAAANNANPRSSEIAG
jgi:hypothetical protein